MDKNPWIAGLTMILFGLFIGVGGIKHYSLVTALIGASFSWGLLWAIMLLYQEPLYEPPKWNWRRVLLDIFMSGLVFFILMRFKTINIFFTGIFGGLFLGMILAISISAIANWNSFYMMSFVMGCSAFISLGASYLAWKSD